MEVIIFGTGCSKCKALEKMVKDVIEKNNIDASVIKIEDFKEIVKYTMTTPALMIDGVIKLKGHLPSMHDLTMLLENSK